MNACTTTQFLDALFSSINGAFIEARLINNTGQSRSYFYNTVQQFAQAAPKNLEEQIGFNRPVAQ